jgi:nucleoside-diphosphate-sugar epimerase
MKLLVLGGTHFVGRAVVEAAAGAGFDVTMLNRGRTTIPGYQVRTLRADRTDPAELSRALGTESWDVVLDTWSDAPLTVAHACARLADRAGRFVYVSTASVYAEPIPVNVGEDAPVVAAGPDSTTGVRDFSTYPAAKRGAELAVLRAFGAERTLIARPGLILGPYEDAYRLPWWLRRMERGGKVLAPGEPAHPVQYVDVRDMASWLLDAARRGTGGVFNVVSRSGHTTMGELLSTAIQVTGGDAELVWTPQEIVLNHGVNPWSELPIWEPSRPGYPAGDTYDVAKAFAAGLRVRPVQQTVAGTWAWLRAEGDPAPRPGRPRIGLDPAREHAILGVG